MLFKTSDPVRARVMRPGAAKQARAEASTSEGKKIAVNRAASTAASTTGKGITRKMSKGEATGYAKTVYKAITRGERMLAAAQE